MMIGRPEQRFRLRPDVQRVRRRGGQVVLVSGAGRPLRISRAGDMLAGLLTGGATLGELATHLRSTHPRVVEVHVDAAVRRFLDALAAAAMLEGSAAARMPGRMVTTVDVERLIRRVAEPLTRLPAFTAWLVPAASIAGLCVSALYIRTETPRLVDILDHFTWAGLAICGAFVVPLHEFAHAITASLLGVRAIEFGFDPGPLAIVRPFVRTPGAIAAGRGRRCAIAAAGPAMDSIVCGVAACAAIAWPTADIPRFVFLGSLLALIASTGPLHDGDGCHMLTAWLDDDLAREAALIRQSPLSSRRTVWLYRIAAVMHTAVAALLLWWLR
jgi:hypothetical protein